MKATEPQANYVCLLYMGYIIQCSCRWRNASKDHDSSCWW